MEMAAAILALSYLAGSVSFAFMAGRLKGVDLRREGSGTLGARNVKRVMGALPALIVLILDVAKGAAIVWLAMQIWASPYSPMLAWVGLVCGHGWSLFLRFKGGKGLAASMGALALISPSVLASELWIGFLMFIFTRNAYISAIIMTVILPAVIYLMTRDMLMVKLSVPVSILILLRHRENILHIMRSGSDRVD